jgi:hypothetical protein
LGARFGLAKLEAATRGNSACPAGVLLDDTEHEVKSIISHREDRDGIRYLVHWKGYSPEDSTWAKAENCKNANCAETQGVLIWRGWS